MRTRWNFYITGIILIILGALTFRYPIGAIMTAGFFIGCGLVASGLNYIAGFCFFTCRQGFRPWRLLALGILDLIAGVVMVIQPGLSAFFMPFVIGLWLFLTGLARTCSAFWLGGSKIQGWWVMLLNGIALIIAALLMCASPLVSSLSIMLILSCVLISEGVLAILEGYMVKS